MRKFKVTPKNLEKVFGRLLDIFRLPNGKLGEGADVFCARFNVLLDDLLGEDFFGTEGQCDPRGDHRN